MKIDLSGKVALITGASKGIGHQMALTFAAAGAAVAVNYNSDAAGAADAVARITEAGGRAVALQADIRTAQGCHELVEQTVAELGRLDITCCHAGVTSWGKFLDYTEEAFDDVVSTNMKGTYFTAQAAARQMIKQGEGGRIIITSSVTGTVAVEYLSAYGMTKAAGQLLARNLVLELAGYGITINAIVPGSILNERNLIDDPEYGEKWSKLIPVGRAGEPADVAAAALFLASDHSGFINGVSLHVDGGWTTYSPTPGFEFVERENRVGKGREQ